MTRPPKTGKAHDSLATTLALFWKRIAPFVRAYWLYVLIGVLVVFVLFLPPISLLERLGVIGHTSLDAANASVSDPAGITVSVDPQTFTDRLRVQIDVIPQERLLSGHAGASLKRAVGPDILPNYIEIKSSYCEISVHGSSEQPVLLDLVLSPDAEPWETLDLYTWTGDAWEWVGSELHTETAADEFIRARVLDVPSSLVLMQAGPITPTISTTLEPDEPLGATHMVDEINPTGMMLAGDCGLVGDPDALLQPVTGTNYVVMPAPRNWAAGTPVARGPLSDVLENAAGCQETHVASVVQLCAEWGFAGVDLDYRGLTAQDREAFSALVAALANALHEQGLLLTVVVGPPTPHGGGWDTGGYDWPAIAASADGVKVPFPADLTAYDGAGDAQRLLDWAKTQVPRFKLRPLVSPLSAEHDSGGISYISLQQALAPFGQAVSLFRTSVESGGEIEFGLLGDLLSITPLEDADTYRLVYRTADGGSRTVWLGTPASLATKLRLAQRYNVGGIAVTDLYDPGNAGGIVDTVASYRTPNVTPHGQEINVLWKVTTPEMTLDQKMSPLTDPGFVWTAAVAAGTYTVKAIIAGLDHGSVEVTVGEIPPEPDAAVGGGSEEADCLKAAFVSETVPDGTHFDKGETFVKSWTLKNTGTCAWPSDTALVKVESETGGPESVAVGPVAVDETVEISVDMTAPDGDGNFKSQWALHAGGDSIAQVWALIQAGDAPPPQRGPVSGSFELGGHILNEGYPYAEKMHYAGMKWAKLQVRYDPANNAAQSTALAHANGFKIQLSALGPPELVIQPGFEQNVANWVASMAAAGADAIEIWNEPNIDREWLAGHIDPAAYTRLLCACYDAIKAANPATLVISAAPAPTGYFGGCGPNGCDDLPWLQGMYNAGAVNCMDYLGAHHNAGATPPSAREGHPADDGRHHHSWYFLPQTELYFNTFGSQRQLFYTEMGFVSPEGHGPIPTGFGDWGAGTTVAQHAAWLAEAVQLSINTGMVHCIIVWNIDYQCYGMCGGVPDPQAGYAIIRPGGSCPACDTLHAAMGVP